MKVLKNQRKSKNKSYIEKISTVCLYEMYFNFVIQKQRQSFNLLFHKKAIELIWTGSTLN